MNVPIACVVLVRCANYIVGVADSKGRGVILPGGKMDPGETFKDCAARELAEETGIIKKPEDLDYLWSGLNTDGWFVYVFETTVPHIDPDYRSKEGRVVLTTWQELFLSRYQAFYQILCRM